MKIKYLGITLALTGMLLATGCGTQSTQTGATQAVAVNAYKVTAEDTTVEYAFPGTIIAKNEVPVRSRVSGHVIEKYINGGEQVEAGQALFKLDSRQYEASLAAAQASAAQTNANYQNAKLDLGRYETLAKENAIAMQQVDTQRSATEQTRAAYEASEAQVKIAQDNLNDTVVYAPFSGTLRMDDVDLGTFVTAGSTALVTISSTDPVYVEFSLSEAEYLNFMKKATPVEGQLQLRLSDGTIYGEMGKIAQISKSLESGTGKLEVKAEFPNAGKLLIPGMYGTVISNSEKVSNAILIPQKALVQILDKNFVMVVDADGKVKQVPVTLGATKGKFILVSSGLSAGDQVIVDGLTKVKAGMAVKATYLTKEQIDQAK